MELLPREPSIRVLLREPSENIVDMNIDCAMQLLFVLIEVIHRNIATAWQQRLSGLNAGIRLTYRSPAVSHVTTFESRPMAARWRFSVQLGCPYLAHHQARALPEPEKMR